MRSVAFAILALGALACSPDPTGADANTNEISVSDDFFTPDVDTVSSNETVTFTFSPTNAHTHNVTWDSGPTVPAGSGDKIGGQSYTAMLGTAGTYLYHCTYHGTGSGGGMAATLVVKP